METSFVKRLTNFLDTEEAGAVHRLLLLHHIEVYVQEEESKEEKEKENARMSAQARRAYRCIGEGELCPAGVLYVPRADYEQAVTILRENDEESGLAPNEPETESETESESRSELEQMEDAFLKRRKWHMAEWLVIIVLALLYFFFRR